MPGTGHIPLFDNRIFIARQHHYREAFEITKRVNINVTSPKSLDDGLQTDKPNGPTYACYLYDESDWSTYTRNLSEQRVFTAYQRRTMV